jgi:hypothetical protein
MPKRQKVRKGQSALKGAISHGYDNLKSFAVQRYTGKKAPNNIARDISMLRAMFNTETKHMNTLTSVTSVYDADSEVFALPTCGQGTTNLTRTGDSIKITSIDLKVLFQFSSGTATSSEDQTFNWYLVRYKKTPAASGATAFAISEFLDQDFNSTYTPMSMPNTDTAENFDVLACGIQTIQISSFVAGVTNGEHHILDLSLETDFHQTYNGTGASNICDNMCFFVVTALKNINTGGVSNCQVNARFYFVDN